MTPPYQNQTRITAIALLIILAGLLLLLNSLKLLPPPIPEIFITWQMLLIVLGFIVWFTSGEKIAGIVMVIIGGIFLLGKFYQFHTSIWNVIWPILLILIGINILTRRWRKGREPITQRSGTADGTVFDGSQSDFSPDTINEIAIFGGNEKLISSSSFKGGKITTIFGGSEINFSRSELADGVNTLEILCIFGGVKLTTPPHWDVRIDVVSVLGGFSDKRFKIVEKAATGEKMLLIKGLVIFGGGELKSYS